MARARRNSFVRPLAVYGLLLELYPRAYLRRHREELLQNFQDLERDLPSRAALWWFIARDMASSLRSELARTLWGQTAIRFGILSLMLLVVRGYPGPREQAAWLFCCGYALGWFAGWLGRRWRLSPSGRPRGFVGSFTAQAAMLAGAMVVVLAVAQLFPDLQERLVLAFCYAMVLAWLSGWWSNYRNARLSG